MNYLLDTDQLSILEQPKSAEYPRLVAQINLHDRDDVGVSVISLHEQTVGAHGRLNRITDPAELVRGYGLLAAIIEAFQQLPLVLFDETAASVLAGLQLNKIRVKPMDLRIAAVALANGLTLVTRNRSDFDKVPGLTTEDWTK